MYIRVSDSGVRGLSAYSFTGLGQVLTEFDPAREAEFLLGQTRKGTAIVAHFFPGVSKRRALIVAGVHGSELSGIEVVQRLVQRLKSGAKPGLSVLIIPELFPDNAAIARKATGAGSLRPGADSNLGRSTKGSADPNRQFPPPGTDFVPGTGVTGVRVVDPENQILMQVIQEFKPERIASVHAKSMRGKGRPGIFADPHSWSASATANDILAAELRTQRDANLALGMARHAATKGARTPGNRLSLTCVKSRCPTWVYGEPPAATGTSLGEWGPQATPARPAAAVITVEVQHFYPSEPMPKKTPVGAEKAAGVSNRLKELEAHRDALLDVFLNP
jgi:hypothetical protein